MDFRAAQRRWADRTQAQAINWLNPHARAGRRLDCRQQSVNTAGLTSFCPAYFQHRAWIGCRSEIVVETDNTVNLCARQVQRFSNRADRSFADMAELGLHIVQDRQQVA